MTARWWMPGALVALGIAGCGGHGRGPATPAVADPAKTLRAVRLTVPVMESGAVSARQARRLTARVRRLVPLPAGGSFAGVRWEAAGRAPIPRAQVWAVLEFNAVCQWTRALREGREPGTARSVLATALRWPAMRGVDTSQPGFAVSCYAAHDREVRWAVRRGRRPTT